MQIFDSHCHLDDRVYDNDRAEVIVRARKAGVTRAMIAGVDLESARRAMAIADQFDGIYGAVGIHPHDVKDCSENVLAELAEAARHPRMVAWGEVGLDFNRMYSPRQDQEKWFQRQLEIAATLTHPLIFHERDSRGRLLEILKGSYDPLCRGVVHCFSGNREELKRYLDLDLYIGITGIVTIKSRGKALRQLLRYIPSDRLVVETDAPYLTPTPERNKFRRNEPAFVKTVLLKIAAVLALVPEELARQVWDNTHRLFGLDKG
jgi:TatD DNase family protein